MRRHRFILTALTIALAACSDQRASAPGIEAPQATPTARRRDHPNVIYILADDLGLGDIGPYGQKIIRTPNLDRLAAEGMRFTQHYAMAVCAPSRAMLLTGKDSGHAPIRGNFELGGYSDAEEGGQLPLPPGTFTWGRLMQQAGYRTAVVGKWGLGGFDGKGLPKDFGFDHSFGFLDQKQAHNYYPTHLWKDGQRYPLDNPSFSAHQTFPKDADPNDPHSYDRYKGRQYALDEMAKDAVAFIRENKDRPFFLYFAPTTPHVALQVPDEELAQYDGVIQETGPYLGDKGYLPHPRPRAAYAAMITRLDHKIGQMMDELERLGIDDNTVILFASDNGPSYVSAVDLEYFDSTTGLRGRKDQVYEGGIRSPLIVRWPGHVAPGSTSPLMSATWDMLPTFADLLNKPVPKDVNGLSLLPTLLGEPGQKQHEWLYWEHHDDKGSQAVRLGQWKAVRLGGKADANAPIRLYDLSIDPAERHDVAAQHPDVVRRIAGIMRDSHLPSPVQEWNFK